MKIKNRYMVFLSNNTFEYIPKSAEAEAELLGFDLYRDAIFQADKTGDLIQVISIYDTKKHRKVLEVGQNDK